MREPGPWELTLYLALAGFLALLGTSLLLPLEWPYRLLLAGVGGLVMFGLIRYGLTRFIYRRIELIHSEIITSIKNQRFKNKAERTTANPLEKLDFAVRRLIREKTLEIDNLKELERMRKEFLGDVAHELRSPIFNIQGYLHTLLEGALDDEQVSLKFLGKAAKHVDHLSSLVEDLVTISRIEAGELRLERMDFDLKELITEVLDLQDLPAKGKNIHLSLKFDTEPPLPVNADRAKIRQVLMNLVGNSIKYGRLDGATTISLSEDHAHNLVTVSVSDNGEGIAEEHLPRIFERFYRVDKSRARTEPSTGLGLAIVKHFIEAHRQKIEVTSREGVGSIFSFTLEKSR